MQHSSRTVCLNRSLKALDLANNPICTDVRSLRPRVLNLAPTLKFFNGQPTRNRTALQSSVINDNLRYSDMKAAHSVDSASRNDSSGSVVYSPDQTDKFSPDSRSVANQSVQSSKQNYRKPSRFSSSISVNNQNSIHDNSAHNSGSNIYSDMYSQHSFIETTPSVTSGYSRRDDVVDQLLEQHSGYDNEESDFTYGKINPSDPNDEIVRFKANTKQSELPWRRPPNPLPRPWKGRQMFTSSPPRLFSMRRDLQQLQGESFDKKDVSRNDSRFTHVVNEDSEVVGTELNKTLVSESSRSPSKLSRAPSSCKLGPTIGATDAMNSSEKIKNINKSSAPSVSTVHEYNESMSLSVKNIERMKKDIYLSSGLRSHADKSDFSIADSRDRVDPYSTDRVLRISSSNTPVGSRSKSPTARSVGTMVSRSSVPSVISPTKASLKRDDFIAEKLQEQRKREEEHQRMLLKFSGDLVEPKSLSNSNDKRKAAVQRSCRSSLSSYNTFDKPTRLDRLLSKVNDSSKDVSSLGSLAYSNTVEDGSVSIHSGVVETKDCGSINSNRNQSAFAQLQKLKEKISAKKISVISSGSYDYLNQLDNATFIADDSQSPSIHSGVGMLDNKLEDDRASKVAVDNDDDISLLDTDSCQPSHDVFYELVKRRSEIMNQVNQQEAFKVRGLEHKKITLDDIVKTEKIDDLKFSRSIDVSPLPPRPPSVSPSILARLSLQPDALSPLSLASSLIATDVASKIDQSLLSSIDVGNNFRGYSIGDDFESRHVAQAIADLKHKKLEAIRLMSQSRKL